MVFTPEAKNALENHPWQGNIRELQNVIERALISAELGKRFVIEIEDIELSNVELRRDYPAIPNGFLPSHVSEIHSTSLESCLDWMERTYMRRSLQLVQGDNKKLIELLGLSRAHYYRRKKELDFEETEANLA